MSNFPARIRTADLVVLPRLLILSVVVSLVGLALGFQHEPGTLTVVDLLAASLLALGLVGCGCSLQPAD